LENTFTIAKIPTLAESGKFDHVAITSEKVGWKHDWLSCGMKIINIVLHVFCCISVRVFLTSVEEVAGLGATRALLAFCNYLKLSRLDGELADNGGS